MSDGSETSVKLASQIRVGDHVRGICTDGTLRESVTVVGIVRELVGRDVCMVEVSQGNFMTPGHPIQRQPGGLFVRPKAVSAVQHRYVDTLYNFVLSEHAALVLHTPTDLSQECKGAFVACSSLGQFCPGVDAEGSFFGSTRVVEQCMRNPQWPTITKNSTRN